MQGDWLRTADLSALAAVIWTARRFLPAVFPFLGIGIMVLLAVGLATEARNGQSGGITGTAAALVSHSAAGAVAIAALMSVAMAMLNMIPLHPLDSGRIMRAIIRSRLGQRAADRYGAFSTITCLVLVVVLPLLTDILHLLHRRL